MSNFVKNERILLFVLLLINCKFVSKGHYNFSDDNMTLDSRIALNWLYMDNGNVLWSN